MNKERRARALRTTDLEDSIIAAPIIYFIALAICSAIGAFAYGIASSEHNKDLSAKRNFAEMVYSDGDNARDTSPEMTEKRKELASDIVSFNDRLKQIGSDEYLSISQSEYEALQHIATTGEPVVITDRNWKMGTYFWFVYVWPGLPVLLLLLMTGIFIGYVNETSSRYCLADLPWRKPWTWLLTLFVGPFGWIAFAVSGMRLRKLPRIVVAAREMPNVVIANEYTEVDESERLRAEQHMSEAKYVSSPNAARQFYAEMRLNLLAKRRMSRLDQVTYAINTNKETLRSLGQDVKRVQQATNELAAEKRVIEEAMSQIDDSVDPRIVGEEFERIMTLPGVIAVQVVNNNLRIIVRAVHTYKGKKYDMGDWQMDFGPDAYHGHATPLRFAVKPSWGGGYPDYRYGSGFCFGSRQTTIDEHLAKGQYMEAIALAVECLSSANADDRKNIPHAFYEIKE